MKQGAPLFGAPFFVLAILEISSGSTPLIASNIFAIVTQ